ncbi:hypothetical protein ACPIMS_13845, partial [Acinetobacter baumannii]
MKVVLKRSILILFLTGNIIGLSYAQAAELEPVKLKKSCIKKNPLAEGQNDPELLNIFKQGEFKHEVRQFQKPYDNQQAEQISLM